MKKARHTVYMVLLSCVSWANCFSFLSLSFLICQIRVIRGPMLSAREPTRLLHPWDFPGKSTGVGCHCLLRNEKSRGAQNQASVFFKDLQVIPVCIKVWEPLVQVNCSVINCNEFDDTYWTLCASHFYLRHLIKWSRCLVMEVLLHFTDEETEVEGVKIGYEKYTGKVREVTETGYKGRGTCVLQAGSHKLR